MDEGISVLSLVASLYYLLVVIACAMAASTAVTRGQPTWHKSGWLGLAVLFALLMAMRGLGLEEWLRDTVRGTMRSDGSYEGRREFQSILVAIVLVVTSVVGFWWLYRVTRGIRGRRNVALVVALASGGAMAFLVLLRLVSLHAIDRVLYGPFKLNWFGDLGTSSVVVLAALFYAQLVRARP